MAKKGDINWLLVVAVVAVGYFVLVGNPFEQEPAPVPSPTPEVCAVEDVAFTPKLTRMGKAGTSLSTSSYNYYIITDSIGHQSASSATTVPTETDLKVMLGENSTEYYTKVVTVNTGCQDPLYFSDQLAYADSSLNTKYLENSDGTVNSASDTEALGTGETFETTAYIKAGADTYFGNPYSSCENVAVCEYDKTYFISCKGDDPVPVPGAFSYTNSTYDGSNAFVIPKSADGEKVSFNVIVETSGSNDPIGTGHPQITLYDCDVDKDEDTLEIIEGVEDEDLNSLSLQSQTLHIYTS
jgi:hypothetical protein